MTQEKLKTNSEYIYEYFIFHAIKCLQSAKNTQIKLKKSVSHWNCTEKFSRFLFQNSSFCVPL